MSAAARAQALQALHVPGDPLVLTNVWDAASARAVLSTGAPALASASHAIAAMRGLPDGGVIGLDAMLESVGWIVGEAGDVPVSADLESGYGDAGEAVRRAIAVGVVGANLEDGRAPRDEAVAAVRAAVAAGEAEGVPFVLNARTDAFVKGEGSPEDRLAEAMDRARAFAEAGAPSIFVPGAREAGDIEALVDACEGVPLSVIVGPGSLTRTELAEIGVARISVGPWSQRHVLDALAALAGRMTRGDGTMPEIDGSRSDAVANLVPNSPSSTGAMSSVSSSSTPAARAWRTVAAPPAMRTSPSPAAARARA